MAVLWSFSGQQVRDLNGRAYPGAKAYFYDSGTTTDRSVYTDGALTTRHSQPVLADAQGRFPAVYVTVGQYRFRVVTAQDVSIGVDFDEVTGGVAEVDPSGSVEAAALFITGDGIWSPRNGTRTGWVRDNGRTIGSGASGATERANADVEDLYAWYWEGFSDSICAVVGARGASAAADFASNKAIATLDMRGMAAIGADDMGNLASGRLQVSTTITTTNGSNLVTAASIANISVGYVVTSANIPVGTSVAVINTATNVLTLSANASATAGGTAARISRFTDAQVPGQSVTTSFKYLLQNDLPVITPSGTITVTQGTVPAPNVTNGGFLGTGSGLAGSSSTYPTSGVSATFAGTPFGGGMPISMLQPSMIGTWFRKL
jgi:hypothetical protein